MINRIPMNSASLQGKFPEIYRDFFSKCPIVVSAPGSFFWFGEHAVMFGMPSIVQKLPLRMYVGLEKTWSSDLEIGTFKYYVPSEHRFETINIDRPTTIKILKMASPLIKGYKINFLSEIPPECGLNSSGSLSGALSIAIHMATQKFNGQALQKWDKTNCDQLKKDPKFNEIYRLAWKIDSAFHADSSSGSGPYVPLISSSYPLVFFSEARNGDFNSHPQTFMPSNLMGHYELIDQINYWGYRMDELFDFSFITPFCPVDFGLIFTGNIKNTGAVIKSTKEIKDNLENAKLSTIDIFQPKISEIAKERQPLFFKKIIQKDQGQLWECFIDNLMIKTIEGLWIIKNLFEKGISESLNKELFKTVDQYQSQLKNIGVSSQLIDQIIRFIKHKSDELKLGSDNIGIKITGAGKGGDLLFVTNFGSMLRSHIDEIIAKLEEHIQGDIWLDYASWIDGIEEEGARIEQHLADNIYSQFISEGSISYKTLTKEGLSQTEISSLENFDDDKNKIDLLIDQIEGDLYIRGKKLTSKEIPSSSTTVEILSILIDNLGKSLPNAKLPESSYSEDRNEMQSKIISPLIKTVKKITNKNLPLKISGGIVDFKLKLDPGDLEIRILSKIF